MNINFSFEKKLIIATFKILFIFWPGWLRNEFLLTLVKRGTTPLLSCYRKTFAFQYKTRSEAELKAILKKRKDLAEQTGDKLNTSAPPKVAAVDYNQVEPLPESPPTPVQFQAMYNELFHDFGDEKLNRHGLSDWLLNFLF